MADISAINAMYNYLLDQSFKRRKFDPSKEADREEVKFFLANNKWKQICPFYVEHPWLDIPTMCKDKIAAYTLDLI